MFFQNLFPRYLGSLHLQSIRFYISCSHGFTLRLQSFFLLAYKSSQTIKDHSIMQHKSSKEIDNLLEIKIV